MGSQWTGYRGFVVIQKGNTPVDHQLFPGRLCIISEDKKQDST